MLSADHLIRLSRLLDEALALAPAQREAWLTTLPPENAHLAEPLREMLAREAGLTQDGRLRTLPRFGAWESEDAAAVQAGDLIGPYRLLEEIGRGGMGSVWRAERADGSYQREVALKLPRLTWGEGLARLMAQERDIGAMLEHPNIARLYDAGIDARGWPYLALELVAGRPIDAWCRERNASVAQRLELLLQIMRAVGYAHGRLIVHRDIKPSNVLVTPDGQAHLLDFGIARLLGDAAAGVTEDGARRLTPHYASPEQVRGDPVTVATDVYSLGVLAFELLTGQTPYRLPGAKPASRAAWEEAVLADEPERASSRCEDRTTARALHGDLDAILAKALRRDPAQRYASVDAFAQDLERFRRGEAVLAQPDSAWYRLGRTVRRHRLAFATTGIVVAALAVGGGLALRQNQRAELAAQRQQMATSFAAALLRADQAAFFARTDSRRPTPELTLADSAALIQQRFAGEPGLQADLLGAVARLFLEMDRPELAAEHAQRQHEILQRADAGREALAASRLLAAEAWLAAYRWTEADVAAQQALKLADKDGPQRAEALALTAQAAWPAGHVEAAQAALTQAEALLPSLPSSSTAAARVQALRAEMADHDYRYAEADEHFGRSIALALAAQGETSPLLQRLRRLAAQSLIDHGRTDAAAPMINAVVRDLKARGGPAVIEARIMQAEYELARYRAGLASYLEASQTADSAAALIDAQPDPPQAQELRLNLLRARLAFAHGDMDKAWDVLHDSFPSPWQGPRSSQKHWQRLHWTAMDISSSVGPTYGHSHETDSYWNKLVQDAQMRPPKEAGDLARHGIKLAAKGQADAGLLKLEGETLAPPARAMLAWVKAQILLDLDRPADAAAAVRGLDPSPTPDLPPERFSSEAVAAQLECAHGRPTAGRDRLVAQADALLRDRNPAAPRPAWLRAHAGLCALAAGDRAGALALAAQARQAFKAQPEVAAYYKQPLKRLEAALGPTSVAAAMTRDVPRIRASEDASCRFPR
ncbi:protein kinase domain-containing protein [Roseateles sp. NT4]|uniref:protein kinase domain-containing protein n=1 Tax=Roseateles sp. NT4 TaxID=3453715 RepID=UPI003EEC82E3